MIDSSLLDRSESPPRMKTLWTIDLSSENVTFKSLVNLKTFDVLNVVTLRRQSSSKVFHICYYKTIFDFDLLRPRFTDGSNSRLFPISESHELKNIHASFTDKEKKKS